MLPPHWFEYLKACITGFEGLEVVSSGGFRYISPTGWVIELKWNKLWICVHKNTTLDTWNSDFIFWRHFFFLLRKKNKNILHFCSLQIGHRKTNKNPNFQILLKMFFLLLYELKKKKKSHVHSQKGRAGIWCNEGKRPWSNSWQNVGRRINKIQLIFPEDLARPGPQLKGCIYSLTDVSLLHSPKSSPVLFNAASIFESKSCRYVVLIKRQKNQKQNKQKKTQPKINKCRQYDIWNQAILVRIQ